MQQEQCKNSGIQDQKRTAWGKLKKGYSKLGTTGNVLIVLLLIVILLSILSPYFLTIGNITNIARQTATLAIVAVGITMVIITGGIDLSVASNISFNNVLMAILIVNLKMSLPLVILLVLVSGVALGLFNGFLITILKIPPIIATLSTSISYSGMAWAISQGYGINIPRDNPITILGNGNVGPIPVSLILVVIIYIIAFLIMRNTRFGRILYGLGGNSEAVYLSGLSVRKYTLIVYMVSGFFAALAGIVLTGRVVNGHPNGGNNMEMDSIAATVLGGASVFGGVGNIWGTLIGVFTMTIIINGLNLLQINPYIQIIVKGLVLAGSVGLSCIKRKKR
jgi:ribose transport system permease protein